VKDVFIPQKVLTQGFYWFQHNDFRVNPR
jgi:hypothetical protein